jgi:membrane protein DedA with SNARE-associated domain
VPPRRLWIAVGLASALGIAAAGALPPPWPTASAVEAAPATAADRVGDLIGAAVGATGAQVEPFTGWRLLWVLGAIALATLITEDLTCIAAGVLVARGLVTFVAATSACLAGIFFGDLLLVGAGRWLGRPALARAPLKWLLTPAAVDRSARWFRAQGVKVVLLSRFVPGSRLPLYVAAGILHAPLRKVAIALLLAGGVWTPLLVGLAARTHGAILARLESYQRYALPALLAVGIVVLAVVHLLIPALTWRGRRLLLSKWRRLTRWEFWPLWLFNLPVLLHWLWLGLRHRHLTLFTAANPGIPAGGFVLESKSAILGRLPPEVVPRFARVELAADPAERMRQAVAAIDGLGLDFPVVGKPDVGERGAGVGILHDGEDLRLWLESAPTTVLLQEYAPGEEFGVFYVRRPSEARGRIFSITAKTFPVIEGDGRRTVEELILGDDRAVCMALVYLERNVERLAEVLGVGERLALVDIGNHCRGTIFRDGRRLATPALEARIEAIARAFDGFCFGRFDLRAPNAEALQRGEELRVIELNGVTSEATHIYEPGASLLAAWRTLFEQWRLAFAIGAENAALGARTATLGELLGLLAQRRRLSGTIPGSRGE